MATTTPRTFVGTPTLDAEKVALITEWYRTSLGDADKASTIEDAEYNQGSADAFRAVLALLHPQNYEKCAHCHLFIEDNEAFTPGEGIARYVHLHRGDDADEALISTHDAEPSGEVNTLDWWRENGPAEMRARFTEED